MDVQRAGQPAVVPDLIDRPAGGAAPGGDPAPADRVNLPARVRR
ncbi:hypothetical protein APASM_3138 [Actinosynnema pretiosum subsp. pretiosum]|nr:hypothetical protein APASM_3138 [Actinosynnema pretiosum subsp. pretiosum]